MNVKFMAKHYRAIGSMIERIQNKVEGIPYRRLVCGRFALHAPAAASVSMPGIRLGVMRTPAFRDHRHRNGLPRSPALR